MPSGVIVPPPRPQWDAAMNLAKVTVSRPVFTTMMTLIAVLVGAFSVTRLPIDLMPDVSFPTVTVRTVYENAAPEEVEESVTRRVEEAVATVAGIEQLTSQSSEGGSRVRISFAWGTDLEVAANDIRDRLDRITNALPAEADRPRLSKFDPNASPILIYGVASTLNPLELRRIIDDQISYRIERIPGVATLDTWGGLEREIQVHVDASRIQALNLPLNRVRSALQEANITVPAGDVQRGHLEIAVRTPGKFNDLSQIEDVVIAHRNGSNVRLRQVADIVDSHERETRIIRIDQGPGVRIAVRKQAGSNTVEVADAIKAEMKRVGADFPQLTLVPITDQSEYIQNSIDNLGRTILYGGILAIFVLLLFLRSVRGTLVVAVAIPTSIITTFALLHFGGFTLNLMTLGGLALGVGLMVDNAIVVLENISRVRNEEADDSTVAAVRGTAQIGPAIIASTLTTLVIFAPLIFGEGISGEMFGQLAYTVGFALLCSLLAALTVVPMLASRLLRSQAESEERLQAPRFYLLQRLRYSLGQTLAHVEHRYQAMLKCVLHNKAPTLVVAMGIFALSLTLLPRIGMEFMPQADQSEVRISVDMEPGTRLALLDQVMREVEEIAVANVPEMRSSYTRVGTGNSGRMEITLVGVRERSRSSQDIADSLRPMFNHIAGARIRTRPGRGHFLLRMGSSGSDGEPLEIEVRGFDIETLQALAVDIEQRVRIIDNVTDTRISREEGVPQELMRINRARAADMDVSIQDAARTLEAAIGGVRAGTFSQNGREHNIRVQIRDAEQLTQRQILNLSVVNDSGRPVSLRNIIDIDEGMGPQRIDRKDQQRLTVVYANISGRDLGSVAADMQRALRDMVLPEGYDAVVLGEFEDQQEAFTELGLALFMAVLLVYMVLASLYESFRDPLIVMFTVPLSIIGVSVMLFLTGTTFSMQSMIGIIMLVGIVVNNSILIVDQTSRLQRSYGFLLYDAVVEAGRRRLRPVLMTTLTTASAMLPLALGVGEGAEQQAPMARAVIGGLLSACFITLLVIPVIYVLFHHNDDAPEPVLKAARGHEMARPLRVGA